MSEEETHRTLVDTQGNQFQSKMTATEAADAPMIYSPIIRMTVNGPSKARAPPAIVVETGNSASNPGNACQCFGIRCPLPLKVLLGMIILH